MVPSEGNLVAPNPGSQATGIYECSPGECALQQGEIISDILQHHLNVESLKKGELVVDDTRHRFLIVASQSCDLLWDYDARLGGRAPERLIPHVLLCETLEPSEIRAWKNESGGVLVNSKTWESVKINKDERFHFFEAVPAHEDARGEGLPELVADFRRCFSMPTNELYWRLLTPESHRRARLCVPYLEHFATRLFQFQARVATPRQHHSV